MSGPGAPEKVSVGISRKYGIFRKIVVSLYSILLGFKVYGAERVPDTGALIVASNHRRYLDPVYVCMAVPRRLQWMGKKELFVFPFERLFYLIGTFPVDRQGGGRSALRAALRYLEMGAALGIFPEGTRRKDENADREAPKNGTVMLASRSSAPILPVYVGSVPNPMQRLRGERLEVYIGEPHVIEGDSKSYKEVAGRLVSEIYALPITYSGESG